MLSIAGWGAVSIVVGAAWSRMRRVDAAVGAGSWETRAAADPSDAIARRRAALASVLARDEDTEPAGRLAAVTPLFGRDRFDGRREA
jgi:hypothetical protein